MKTYTLKDIYKQYVIDGGTLTKQQFKNICCDFNINAMDYIIYSGSYLDLGSNLSYISIIRVDRDYSSKRLHNVNWKASNEYKDELLKQGKKLYDHSTKTGTKWLIYRDEPFYCRFYWNRKNAVIPNRSIYSFIPTRGIKGNKEKLKEHLADNELNALKYRKAKNT